MSDRDAIAWLYRRSAFGLAPGQLDALTARGVDDAVDRLVDPEAHGVTRAPDPWAGIVAIDPENMSRRYAAGMVASWLVAMATTPRPLEEWMRWFWHGHFVSTMRVVKYPQLMFDQLHLFGDLGLGDFRTLLRAVTVDAAMLLYLNGTTSKRSQVNENYGREVLELFALGVGHYQETDVRAGAEALTGYRVDLRASSVAPPVVFGSGRHDDTPKDYLGQVGVHDVDSVIDAIVAHEACAPFITRKLASAILGPDLDDGLVKRLARDFATSGLELRPLVRAIIEVGLGGQSHELVTAPVPWLVSMVRACGVSARDVMPGISGQGLRTAGQVPFDAPSVAGWPGGRAWLSSSATLARFNMASALAAATDPQGLVRVAARSADPRVLADQLGHPEGFTAATTAAIAVNRGSDPTGELALGLALASPELALC